MIWSLAAPAGRLDYRPEPEWQHTDLTIWILAAAAAVLGIAALIYLLRRGDRSIDRAIAIRDLAGRLGLQFSRDDVWALYEVLDRARALTDEECTLVHNVVTGGFRGARMWAADCAHGEWRDTGFSGERLRRISGVNPLESIGHWSSVAVVPCGWTGETVTIIPRTALDRALSGVFSDAPDFVTREFNLAYAIRGAKHPGVRALLTSAVVELLLQESRWTLELVEGAALVHDGGHWEPEAFPEALEFAAKLAPHLPTAGD